MFSIAAAIALAACSNDSVEPDFRAPWEGNWRLVRMSGEPLPFRRDSLELSAEQVTIFANGVGYAADTVRAYGTSSGAPTVRTCTIWLGFQIDGTTIRTVRSQQAPLGTCPPNAWSRTYALDGDTLRLTDGPGLTLPNISRTYVRSP